MPDQSNFCEGQLLGSTHLVQAIIAYEDACGRGHVVPGILVGAWHKEALAAHQRCILLYDGVARRHLHACGDTTGRARHGMAWLRLTSPAPAEKMAYEPLLMSEVKKRAFLPGLAGAPVQGSPESWAAQ